MGSIAKKTQVTNDVLWMAYLQSSHKYGNMIVLKKIDYDKHNTTTWDKHRGKQIWNTPHNVHLDTSIPRDATELSEGAIVSLRLKYRLY